MFAVMYMEGGKLHKEFGITLWKTEEKAHDMVDWILDACGGMSLEEFNSRDIAEFQRIEVMEIEGR